MFLRLIIYDNWNNSIQYSVLLAILLWYFRHFLLEQAHISCIIDAYLAKREMMVLIGDRIHMDKCRHFKAKMRIIWSSALPLKHSDEYSSRYNFNERILRDSWLHTETLVQLFVKVCNWFNEHKWGVFINKIWNCFDTFSILSDVFLWESIGNKCNRLAELK